MAKKSVIQREVKRGQLVAKFAVKRKECKNIIHNVESTKEQKWEAQVKLQKMPVNSSASRRRRRCAITGRPRGVYRKFRLCRNKIRKYAMEGDMPGLKKASW